MINIGIPVKNLAHLALGMLARRIMGEILEHTIVVGTVRAHHRTIYRRFLAHDEIGAGIRLRYTAHHSHSHQGRSKNLIHKIYLY